MILCSLSKRSLAIDLRKIQVRLVPDVHPIAFQLCDEHGRRSTLMIVYTEVCICTSEQFASSRCKLIGCATKLFKSLSHGTLVHTTTAVHTPQAVMRTLLMYDRTVSIEFTFTERTHQLRAQSLSPPPTTSMHQP